MQAYFWCWVDWAYDSRTLADGAWVILTVCFVLALAGALAYEAKAGDEWDSGCVSPNLISAVGIGSYRTEYTYRCDSGRLYKADTMLR